MPLFAEVGADLKMLEECTSSQKFSKTKTFQNLLPTFLVFSSQIFYLSALCIFFTFNRPVYGQSFKSDDSVYRMFHFRD